jgi:hypothetical protein
MVIVQYAEGAYLHRIFKPLCANSFGFPVLLLVPSGKITAERWYFSIYSPNPFITGKLVLDLFYQLKPNHRVVNYMKHSEFLFLILFCSQIWHEISQIPNNSNNIIQTLMIGYKNNWNILRNNFSVFKSIRCSKNIGASNQKNLNNLHFFYVLDIQKH